MIPMTGPGSGAPTLPEFSYALIQVFEGERLAVYKDAAGMLTVGIGHTGPIDGTPLTLGQVITHAKALELFAQDAAPLIALVSHLPLLEAGATVSFGFNCGIGTLRRYLAGQTTIADPVHTMAGGKMLPGLVARRELEEMLVVVSQFLTPRS